MVHKCQEASEVTTRYEKYGTYRQICFVSRNNPVLAQRKGLYKGASVKIRDSTAQGVTRQQIYPNKRNNTTSKYCAQQLIMDMGTLRTRRHVPTSRPLIRLTASASTGVVYAMEEQKLFRFNDSASARRSFGHWKFDLRAPMFCNEFLAQALSMPELQRLTRRSTEFVQG